MKSSRWVSLAAGAVLIFSTATAGAGIPVSHHHHGSANPTIVWVIFGCAGSIIFTAYVKHRRHHRELTPFEASTCGFAYWFNPQNQP